MIGIVFAVTGQMAVGAMLVALSGVFYHKADDMHDTADTWMQEGDSQ